MARSFVSEARRRVGPKRERIVPVIQRLVYALAALRAGASEVEVVYQFLERPNELVTLSYKAEEVSALEEELSCAIAAIQAGDFRPTPSEYACSTCPALKLVCAGPNLRGA